MRPPVIIAPNLMLPGWDGYALPCCAIVRYDSAPLIEHEICHVRQWWRYGLVAFPIVYLWQLWHYGYWDAPLEVEARAVAAAAMR